MCSMASCLDALLVGIISQKAAVGTCGHHMPKGFSGCFWAYHMPKGFNGLFVGIIY